MDPNRRAMTHLTAVIILVTAFAGPPLALPAQADPRGDAAQAQKAVDRAAADLEDATTRAQRAGRLLAQADAGIPIAQNRVVAAKGRVISAQARAETARHRATVAQAAYDVAARRYDAAQRRVAAAHDRLESIAQESYKTSNLNNFNLVIGASGPLDALDRLSYVDRAMENQQDSIDEMAVARREARVAQDEAGLSKRAADTARAEAETALADARAAQVAAEHARLAVIQLTAQRRAALAVATSERAATLARYRTAKAEEERNQQRLRDWEARNGGGPGLRSGARLLMPVRGWKSSDFGWRLNPVYGVWRLHAGMDIAAGGGTPIHAAADGTVINAGWSGGYGNYTCLSHGRQNGKRITTCYGHQSEIDVHSGQRVRRGQLIGRVGTTGGSTGNHLHFEVRVNGEPRDPEGWLPGCLC